MAETRTMPITNCRGLHARASAKFVRLAESFDARITVSKDDNSVGGTSIMGLMMLAACQGSTVDVHAEGPQSGEALDAIEALLADKFGEGE
ncbi:MAG: HPr family phosphocarrier protein [Pseudomonadota bacterium]